MNSRDLLKEFTASKTSELYSSSLSCTSRVYRPCIQRGRQHEQQHERHAEQQQEQRRHLAQLVNVERAAPIGVEALENALQNLLRAAVVLLILCSRPLSACN